MKKNQPPKIADKKKSIVRAAIQILNRKEYHDCPVNEIAKLSNVAKGTIYLYFRSKEELYFAVFFQLIDSVNEIIESISSLNISASRKLELLLENISKFIGSNRRMFLSIRKEFSVAGRLHKQLIEKHTDLLKRIAVIVADGESRGEFLRYPPLTVAAVFLNLSLVIMGSDLDGLFDNKISTRLIFQIFLNGISKNKC